MSIRSSQATSGLRVQQGHGLLPTLNPVSLFPDPPYTAGPSGHPSLLATTDDQDLVSRARDGDLDAFGELVLRHGAAVERRALMIVRSPEDAQDLAQDAMLVAWTRLDRFRGDCAFTSWLYVIVTRLALNHTARQPRHLPLDDRPDVADHARGPALTVEADAAGSALLVAINDLPAPQARAVALHHLYGLSYAEIADRTNSTVAAVRSHLYRGRKTLAATATDWQ